MPGQRGLRPLLSKALHSGRAANSMSKICTIPGHRRQGLAASFLKRPSKPASRWFVLAAGLGSRFYTGSGGRPRGSIPTPGDRTRKYGGNTACIEIRCGNHLFICDAGSGLRELGADLLARGTGPLVGHFFFSHAHWDHIQGFPFFVPADRPGNRFLIYGARQGDDRFYQLLSGQMKSDYFPIGFGTLRAEIIADHLDDGRKEIGDVLVESFPLNHPGGCLGYAFSHQSRKIVYATDNEIEVDSTGPETEGAPRLRLARPALVEIVRDSDLLIADGQY